MKQLILFIIMFFTGNMAFAMNPSLNFNGPTKIKKIYPKTMKWFEDNNTNIRKFIFENHLIKLKFNEKKLTISTKMGGAKVSSVISGTIRTNIIPIEMDAKYADVRDFLNRISNSLENLSSN